jgi:homoaconitase/3-isopropylmalate dehydratase large subunit
MYADMTPKTFVEKILGAPEGAIVFRTPAIVLTNDNTASIKKTFEKMGGERIFTLNGRLRRGVYAKDLSLWIIGKIGTDGANYLSIEYHGEGVDTLSVPDRMTLANLASEMGAKNAVFPADDVLARFLGKEMNPGVWADPGAAYAGEMEIDLAEIFPVVAAPSGHQSGVAAHRSPRGRGGLRVERRRGSGFQSREHPDRQP